MKCASAAVVLSNRNDTCPLLIVRRPYISTTKINQTTYVKRVALQNEWHIFWTSHEW